MYRITESITSNDSCSCTECRNCVCHCSYCKMILEYDDNDHDDDSEDEFPPPPPPLPTSLAQHEKYSIDCQIDRYMNVAIQFHTFLLLLKHFCKWNSYRKCRKTQIAAQRTLFRRIVFRWRSFTESRIQISRSLISIFQVIHKNHYCVLRLALECIIRHHDAMRCLETQFHHWRSFAQHSLKEYREKDVTASRLYKLNHTYQIFQSWRQFSRVNVYRRVKEFRILKVIWNVWIQKTIEGNTNTNEQMEVAMNHFHITCSYQARVILLAWRHYTRSRLRLKKAFHQTRRNYQMRLSSISIKAWTKYHRSLKIGCKSLRMVQTRMWLIMWKNIAYSIKQDRDLLLKIIINRWWIYTQDLLDKKRLRKAAMKQWESFKLNSSFAMWKSFVKSERDRIRTSTTMKEAAWSSIQNCNRQTFNAREYANNFKKYLETSMEPTHMKTMRRFSSVPKSRLSSSRYYNNSFDRSNTAKSLSPPKFTSKLQMRNTYHSPYLRGDRGCNSSLLDDAKAPTWVKRALADHCNVNLRDQMRSKFNDEHSTIRRERYAEPKTSILYDSSSSRSWNYSSFRSTSDSTPNSKGIYHGADFKSYRSSGTADFK